MTIENLVDQLSQGVHPEWIDLGINLALADELASVIAERWGRGVTAVVSWDSGEENVLAHLVARRLDACRASVQSEVGILSFSHPLPAGSRVLAVATKFTSWRPLEPLAALMESHGHTLVLCVSVLENPDVRVPKGTHLVSISGLE